MSRHDGPITVPGRKFEVISDMQLRVVNVTLVMTDCPFGGFLGPDGIGPPEPHDTRADGDAKPPGFRFGTSTLRDHKPTAPPARTMPQKR